MGQIKRGDKVEEIFSGAIGVIADIQYVHDRYQFEHLSGWRYGIENIVKLDSDYFEREQIVDEVLFPEDQEKIEDAVANYPMGSYTAGEVIRLSALLYERGIDAEKQLIRICNKYGIEYS